MIVRWAEIQLRNEDPYPLVIFLQFALVFQWPMASSMVSLSMVMFHEDNHDIYDMYM
jgi:hypothetical protein